MLGVGLRSYGFRLWSFFCLRVFGVACTLGSCLLNYTAQRVEACDVCVGFAFDVDFRGWARVITSSAG